MDTVHGYDHAPVVGRILSSGAIGLCLGASLRAVFWSSGFLCVARYPLGRADG